MNIEILEQLDKIKNKIDDSTLISELAEVKKRIFSNKDLIDKINEYKRSQNEDLKKEIYRNEDYRRFKALENELYFLTLEINQRLNTLTDGKVCQNESN